MFCVFKPVMCLLYEQQGKQSAFKEIYSGLAKQYKVVHLMPSTKYAFRLAAKNDVGTRYVFIPIVV